MPKTEGRSDRSLHLSPLKNKYSFEILCATQTPASAGEISASLDIPIATCYRRIEELVEAGFLESAGYELTSDVGTKKYQRTMDEVNVDLTGGRPTVSGTE